MRDQDFEQLYNEHAQALYGFLAYRTGDPALAEDLLADTFEKALRSRRGFNPRRGSAKNWLYSIALNALRDSLRRRAAAERASERMGPPETEADSAEEALAARDELMRAVAVLSEEEREVVALRYGADMTVPEIAELKKEKLTTIEGRVYRALRKLREQLD